MLPWKSNTEWSSSCSLLPLQPSLILHIHPGTGSSGIYCTAQDVGEDKEFTFMCNSYYAPFCLSNMDIARFSGNKHDPFMQGMYPLSE